MRFAALVLLAGCQVVFGLHGPDGATDDGPGPIVDANIVFVTGNIHNGSYLGVAGADSECASAAADANLTGTFVAWLSEASKNAIDRLAGSRGWVRPDGRLVADLPQQLGIVGPWVPIAKTESGLDVRSSSGLVWTGTNGDGTLLGPTCLDWTVTAATNGRVGDASAGRATFTDSTAAACTVSHRLYCFGTDKNVQLTIPPSQDLIWFVTESPWIPDGLANADAQCATEAQSAGLSGTFLALLGTPTAAAISRFPSNANYVRPDGISMGALSKPFPDSFANVTARAEPSNGDPSVWTGGSITAAAAGAGQSCANWTGGPNVFGTLGNLVFSDSRAYTDLVQASCLEGHHLYCLQVP